MKSCKGKAVGAKLGWRVLKTRHPFKEKHLRVREDKVKLPGGKRKKIAYLERSPAVIIVPVTAANEIILIKHYRYVVDTWCLEVPAGGVKKSENVKQAARRELREETGASCGVMTEVTEFYSANSVTNERCHVFLAEDTVLRDKPKRGAAEQMELHPMPLAEALELVRAGKMKDGQCALAILLCEPLLRAKGFLGGKPTQSR